MHPGVVYPAAAVGAGVGAAANLGGKVFGDVGGLDPQRRTIPPETLHFRRKAIPPKKLQRKTIPPGTPQGRLF